MIKVVDRKIENQHNRFNFLEITKNWCSMGNIELVELTSEQQNTIDQSFKVEYLKDEIEMAKLFDYDFKFDDE